MKRSLFLGCLLICSNVAFAVALPDDSGKVSVSVPEHIEPVVEISKPATKNWFTASSKEDGGKTYIGVGVLQGQGTETRKNGFVTQETQFDTTAVSLKYGYIAPDANRVEFVLDGFSAKKTGGSNFGGNTDKMSFFGANADFLVTIGDYKRFLPYIGMGVGLYNTGFAVNADAGILSGIAGGLELEIAYKMKLMLGGSEGGDITQTITNLYAGLNYKF